jgi:hypothetical protein
LKNLRFWLVVLIAVLLPLRAAVGAVVLCPVGSGAEVMLAHAHDTGGVHEHAAAPQDGHHTHHDPHDGHHQHTDADGKHKLCVAFCSVVPMVSDAPTVPVLSAPGAVRFPACANALRSFVPDGEKRPPRST